MPAGLTTDALAGRVGRPALIARRTTLQDLFTLCSSATS
jgi:hypothetical protein